MKVWRQKYRVPGGYIKSKIPRIESGYLRVGILLSVQPLSKLLKVKSTDELYLDFDTGAIF
jgi:hypothetical protein